jgi:hypothetical protein
MSNAPPPEEDPMRRTSEPSLPRMPGSVILSVVFLGLVALFSLPNGLSWLSSDPALGAIMFVGGSFAAALAVSIALRQRWARIAGIAWAGVMAAFFFVEAMRTVNVTPNSYSALMAFWALLLVFLCRRNTRLWCDDGRRSQTPVPPSPAPRRKAAFAKGDEVELLEDVAGFEEGSVGVIVDVPEDARVVVAAFPDPETGKRTEVTLRAGEIRATGAVD